MDEQTFKDIARGQQNRIEKLQDKIKELEKEYDDLSSKSALQMLKIENLQARIDELDKANHISGEKTMTDIQRYDIVYSEYFNGGGIGKKDNGKFMLVDDHLKVVSDEVSSLKKDIELKDSLHLAQLEKFGKKVVELEHDKESLEALVASKNSLFKKRCISFKARIEELESELKSACELVFGYGDYFGMRDMVDGYYEIHKTERFSRLREYAQQLREKE